MSAHWDDLKTVMHLVRGGSLATAADALGVSYTTVARRVKRAEDDLGLKLFDRLADGYQATEAGAEVARKAAAMETEEFNLMRSLAGADQELRGQLTITAPQLVCATSLLPVFEEFTQRYPDVELHVRSSSELLDLGRREADLAIRISDDPGDSLTGRRLASQQCAVFGAAHWLDKIKAGRDDDIKWLLPENVPARFRALVPQLNPQNILMRLDDMAATIEAAKAGMGVMVMPMFLGRSCPDLVELPLMDPQPFPEIWAVAHRDVWRSARVAAFREILIPHFKKTAHLYMA
ncbi:LysR family transcriptional regulator [Cognatishimia sp. SS12]|uniref:LysR family transcriptional regulator n=1 Tax=Cognatishimia sp. SS12 TaxID=2979465 RepID=UPI002330C319|nr:LysR family transcriptional regulator [Cognatishimia sp. SS12]MDC0738018.1 LysR family transcriptional regulator [Cognatishimia sp. SS12]